MQKVDTGVKWFKSSYSNGERECLEVSGGFPDVVPVRDSKAPDRPGLIVTRPAWAAFVARIGDGEIPAP
ncbi:DUF397 domain-containing protein [Streptomyces luteireticuli]|uniref:DUF397 domain-containing protein n=1 Tax=Streptomyces luteireticuli TaxID=173858 RepID=A0ABN0YNG6_9ACTN